MNHCQTERTAPTEILDIFITRKLEHNAGNTTAQTSTRNILLVHHNSICQSRGNEGQAVREPGPAGIVIEGDVGEKVADDGEEQGQVAVELISFSSMTISSPIGGQKGQIR